MKRHLALILHPPPSRLQSLRLAAVLLLLLLDACGHKVTVPSPDEQIREAWERYRFSEFNAALRIFHSLEISQRPGSEAHLQSLYGQASCWNHRRDGRDIARAISYYSAVIAQAPASPLAAWCALDIVRAKHLAPADQELDYSQLAREYEEVYRKYPDTPAGEEAFLRRIGLSVPTADEDRARKNLDDIEAFLQTHPKTPFLSPLYTLMAESCHTINEEDRRLAYMIEALKTREVDPTTPFFELSTAYWNIAYAAEFEAGNFAIAREYYHRLMAEFPRESRIFAARQALVRMDAVETALREGRTPPPEHLGGALQ
jgi:outer membrane protein assembly factor BamD (BamD/ComL family)